MGCLQFYQKEGDHTFSGVGCFLLAYCNRAFEFNKGITYRQFWCDWSQYDDEDVSVCLKYSEPKAEEEKQCLLWEAKPIQKAIEVNPPTMDAFKVACELDADCGNPEFGCSHFYWKDKGDSESLVGQHSHGRSCNLKESCNTAWQLDHIVEVEEKGIVEKTAPKKLSQYMQLWCVEEMALVKAIGSLSVGLMATGYMI